MQHLLALGRKARRVVLVLAATLISLSSVFLFFNQPAHATATKTPIQPEQIQSEAQLDRAYQFSQEAGEREAIYQQRLSEGQDPKQMPKPFRRVTGSTQDNVPETSLLEKTANKVRSRSESH